MGVGFRFKALTAAIDEIQDSIRVTVNAESDPAQGYHTGSGSLFTATVDAEVVAGVRATITFETSTKYVASVDSGTCSAEVDAVYTLNENTTFEDHSSHWYMTPVGEFYEFTPVAPQASTDRFRLNVETGAVLLSGRACVRQCPVDSVRCR